MKKTILSLVLCACALSFNAVAADAPCGGSKGECPKKEACDKAKKDACDKSKKDGGCCKEKQGQNGKKNSSDQARR